MTVNKAYRFLLKPNAEQRDYFANCFGACRKLWNLMLGEREEIKEKYAEEENLWENHRPKTYTEWKQVYPWMYEVDNLALANTQMHLLTSYKNHSKNTSFGTPQYKSKKSSRKSYTTNNQGNTIRIENGCIKLPKVGLVRIKLHREIPNGYKIKSVTISQEPSGKYYASILTEYEAEDKEQAEITEDNSLGLDYSSSHFYVDSNGYTADMPHFYREAEKRLSREQRKLSKMVKGSNNYNKQRRKVARAYEKVRNSRKDWQHKQSHKLANEYRMVAVEGINYKDMARSLKLAKSTNDNGFGQFRTYLAYKLADKGGRLVTIDKWFPSSKTCRVCGGINSDLTLKDREWTCPHCGARINRDVNAAINIKIQGLALIA